MKKMKLSLLILLLVMMSCSRDDDKMMFSYETSMVTINGNPLQIYQGGNGENTVIFETGLGVDGQTWFENNLFEKIGANNQVIAYHRAGYPPSSHNNDARDLNALSSDLESMIGQFSNNDKVILVGHSLGGAIIRKYAIDNPQKVKAILFIDPNHEDYDVYASITQAQEDQTVQQLENAGNIGGAIEAEQLIENLTILNDLADLPNVPVIVLTSIKQENGLTELDRQDWSDAHKTLKSGISDFTHIETNKSGHFIYLEEPELVESSINQLIQ